MAKWVNMLGATGLGDGSDWANAMGPTEFQTDVGTAGTAETYNFRNNGTLSGTTTIRRSVVFTTDDTTPPHIICDLNPSNILSMSIIGLVMQGDTWISKSTIPSKGGLETTLILENSIFVTTNTNSSRMFQIGSDGVNKTLSIKGCSFKTLNTTNNDSLSAFFYIVQIDTPHTIALTAFTNNYFEGRYGSLFYVNNAPTPNPTITGTYQYDAVYGNSATAFNVWTFQNAFSGTLPTPGSGNLLNPSSPKLVVDLKDITTMTFPDDAYPTGALLDAGDPAVSGTDIFGVTRDSPPDIGAAESVVIPAPTLSVSPSSKSFGVTGKNATVDQTVSVSNTGTANLIMGTLSGLATPFSLVNNNVSDSTIAPDGTNTVVVRWHPTVLNSYSDTLIIPSNDTTVSFLVDGTASEADISVSPAIKNFGLVTTGTSSLATITVTNIGTENLVMQPATGLNTPYLIANDNVSDATIAPAASKTLLIQFSPNTVGNFTDILILNSNDPDTASVSLPVFGDGIPKIPPYTAGRVTTGNSIFDYPE